MKIDAHQHFWRYNATRDAWITDEMRVIRRDFLPGDFNGIDGCVAVQADQSLDETQFLLDLAGRHPFIKGVVGWVDLVAPRLDDTLEALAANPRFRGVRHVAQAEPDDFLARDDVISGIGRLSRLGHSKSGKHFRRHVSYEMRIDPSSFVWQYHVPAR